MSMGMNNAEDLVGDHIRYRVFVMSKEWCRLTYRRRRRVSAQIEPLLDNRIWDQVWDPVRGQMFITSLLRGMHD